MAENMLPLFGGAGKFYVYVYRDPRPTKGLVPIYVGKGDPKRRRADVHWKASKAQNPILARMLAKFRTMGLEPIVEIVAWYDDEDAAFIYEKLLIAKYGRLNLKTGSLCNLTDGGDGPTGMIMSENHKEKLRAINSSRPRSEEMRKKISAKLMGHTVSDETKKKIGQANSGRVLTDEHKEKLRITSTIAMQVPGRIETLVAINKGRKLSPEECARIGNTHRGKVLSEETKEKIRLANIGKSLSLETRTKISAKRIAFVADPEVRKQISIALTGRQVSAETGAKISSARLSFEAAKRLTKLDVQAAMTIILDSPK